LIPAIISFCTATFPPLFPKSSFPFGQQSVIFPRFLFTAPFASQGPDHQAASLCAQLFLVFWNEALATAFRLSVYELSHSSSRAEPRAPADSWALAAGLLQSGDLLFAVPQPPGLQHPRFDQ
jgi:hypothetical protein